MRAFGQYSPPGPGVQRARGPRTALIGTTQHMQRTQRSKCYVGLTGSASRTAHRSAGGRARGLPGAKANAAARTQVRKKRRGKGKKACNTPGSNVVPHRSTNGA